MLTLAGDIASVGQLGSNERLLWTVQFKEALAAAVAISVSRISVLSIGSGSIVVDVLIHPAIGTSTSDEPTVSSVLASLERMAADELTPIQLGGGQFLTEAVLMPVQEVLCPAPHTPTLPPPSSPRPAFEVGLRWTRAGSARPTNGTELINPALAAVLNASQTGTVSFTQYQLDGYGVESVQRDSFIRTSDGSYFRPIEWESEYQPDESSRVEIVRENLMQPPDSPPSMGTLVLVCIIALIALCIGTVIAILYRSRRKQETTDDVGWPPGTSQSNGIDDDRLPSEEKPAVPFAEESHTPYMPSPLAQSLDAPEATDAATEKSMLPCEAILDEMHPGLSNDTPQDRVRRVAWIKHFARRSMHDQARSLGWNGEWDGSSSETDHGQPAVDAAASEPAPVVAEKTAPITPATTEPPREDALVRLLRHNQPEEDAALEPTRVDSTGDRNPEGGVPPAEDSAMVIPRLTTEAEAEGAPPSSADALAAGTSPSIPQLGASKPSPHQVGVEGMQPARRIMKSPRRTPANTTPVAESPRRHEPIHLFGASPAAAPVRFSAATPPARADIEGPGVPSIGRVPSMRRDSFRELPIGSTVVPQPLTDPKSPGRRALWI